MATADYIRGVACGHKDLLGIIVGWLLSIENNGGVWTKLQDFEDTGQMNNDGERNVILRKDNTGELPIIIGLRTFQGYPGQYQAGIQINAYTNYDPSLPWDCQAGTLALPENYNATSHFYENCPAILVGEENVCYWLHTNDIRMTCTVRTPTVPMESSDLKIRKSAVFQQFYLGFMRRIVTKEGYPYPMACQGTIDSLGNPTDGYIQRNFAYNNVHGPRMHLPPFHHDFMQFEGIQPMVYLTHLVYPPGSTNPCPPPITSIAWTPSRFPIAYSTGTGGGNCPVDYCNRGVSLLPNNLFNENPVCGPDLGICTQCADALDKQLKDTQIGIKMFTYDVPTMHNRALYFDGTWGWTATAPIRNAYLKSLCWCMQRITACASYNAYRDMGAAPPLSALSSGIRKDQLPAHFGWNPNDIVDSLSGHRLIIPVYMSIVGSIADLQSMSRETFVNTDLTSKEMYRNEQRRIHIAGILDGMYFAPGLGIAAQDTFKIKDGSQTVTYLALPDVYRDGPFNFCAMKLGTTEWHEENPDLETPKG